MAHHRVDRPPTLTVSVPEAFGCPRPTCTRCDKKRFRTEFDQTERQCLQEFSFSLLSGGARLCKGCYRKWRKEWLAKAKAAA